MICFAPRKAVSKPVAWILPVFFLLLLAAFFILWKRAYSSDSYTGDATGLYYQSAGRSETRSSNSRLMLTSASGLPSNDVIDNSQEPQATDPKIENRTNKEKNQIDKKDNKSDIPIIFGITPTYKRSTQKVDLTSLCHTLMLVPRLVWIVVEDAEEKTGLVGRLLQRCKVESIHMNVKTPPNSKSRGVLQRNAGLDWVRRHCSEIKCNGVLYFMDDDNKYDLRLFEEMRKTEGVSVFPVAFSGGLSVEGPVCEDGKAVKWIASFAPQRSIPIDMAGFAINVRLLLEKSDAVIGRKKDGGTVYPGYLEPEFVGQFATRDTVECRGPKEVLVWHTKTQARINKDNGASAGFEVR